MNRQQASRVSVLVAVALLVALATHTPAAAKGYYYEATTVDVNDKGKERSRIGVRGWVDGAAAKIEFTEGQKGTPFASGMYILTKDGGRTMFLVDPKEKAYSQWDLAAMFSMLGSLTEATGGLVGIDFSNATGKKLGEEPGGTILGYPTKKYTWQNAYDMEMTILGMKRRYHSDAVQVFWVTTALDADGFRVWLRPDRVKTGDQGFDEMLAAGMTNVAGFPLKSVTQSTLTTGKGKEMRATTTMEVTTLREESVGGSTFEVPSGFEERPFLPSMQPPEGEGQTTQTESTASGEDDAEAQEGGGPLSRMKGVFGKKKKDE